VRSRGGDGLRSLAFDGAVDGIDQYLGLDEFDPRPFRLVAIERRGKSFRESVTVVGHALARLLQRLKSLAHVDFAFCWRRESYGPDITAPAVYAGAPFALAKTTPLASVPTAVSTAITIATEPATAASATP